MEYLDIYDEYMNKIGTESRDIVHQNGMWHKTIHCWLYDDNGNIYFQIRADANKLYTTASGHVLAGEAVRDAFRREIHEEIGVDLDVETAIPVEVVFWRQDKPAKNWHDRAFAHVYMNKLALNFHDFHFQESEVAGIVRINARECLDLLKGDTPGVRATKITQNGETEVDITIHDFLVAPNEIAIVKYGLVLQSVIQMFDK